MSEPCNAVGTTRSYLPFSAAALGGVAGAVGGVLAVVLFGLLSWESVKGASGILTGTVVGAFLGTTVDAAIRRLSEPVRGLLGGGVGGACGGGVGAYWTVASAELYRGTDWAVFGGLTGALIGAVLGAFAGPLVRAVVRVAFDAATGRTGE
jgi:hypothetical protein